MLHHRTPRREKKTVWEGNIKEIHGCRNKVAHQKTISVEEFSGINKKINKINKRLDDVIDGIREENFTEDHLIV